MIIETWMPPANNNYWNFSVEFKLMAWQISEECARHFEVMTEIGKMVMEML
jgi:hypothetical protein